MDEKQKNAIAAAARLASAHRARGNALVVALAGASGAGKTFLQEALGQKGFNVLRQVTTRPARPGEDCYDFVTPLEYARMDSAGELVARTSFLGNHYGTRASTASGRMPNVCVLNAAGLADARGAERALGWELVVVGVDTDETDEELDARGARGRGAGFVRSERAVLEGCEAVFRSSPGRGRWVGHAEVVAWLEARLLR